MKVRDGFVSNSSSSSFIIAFKSHTCPTCKRSNDQFLKVLEYCEETDHYSATQIYSKNREETIKAIKANHYLDDDQKNDLINKINLLDSDYDVISFKISQHNTAVIEEIKTESYKIIYGVAE